MRFTLLLLTLLLTPMLAQADTKLSAMPSGIYKMDPTHASLIWKVNHMGLSNYTARFTKFDADILFDNQNPMNSKVKAEIDPTSIKTDYPNPEEKDFDKKLTEDTSWFNTGKYPTIKFLSTKLEKTSDTTGKLTGNLTFLGVTKPVVLDVTFNKALGNHPFANKPAFGFSATGHLNRSDFGMKTYIPTVSDKVEIVIEAEFIYEG